MKEKLPIVFLVFLYVLSARLFLVLSLVLVQIVGDKGQDRVYIGHTLFGATHTANLIAGFDPMTPNLSVQKGKSTNVSDSGRLVYPSPFIEEAITGTTSEPIIKMKPAIEIELYNSKVRGVTTFFATVFKIKPKFLKDNSNLAQPQNNRIETTTTVNSSVAIIAKVSLWHNTQNLRRLKSIVLDDAYRI